MHVLDNKNTIVESATILNTQCNSGENKEREGSNANWQIKGIYFDLWNDKFS
jgi:hypothetical protein